MFGVTKSSHGGPFRSKEMMDLILVLGLSLKCDKFFGDFLEIKGSAEGMNTYCTCTICGATFNFGTKYINCQNCSEATKQNYIQ